MIVQRQHQLLSFWKFFNGRRQLFDTLLLHNLLIRQQRLINNQIKDLQVICGLVAGGRFI